MLLGCWGGGGGREEVWVGSALHKSSLSSKSHGVRRMHFMHILAEYFAQLVPPKKIIFMKIRTLS